MFLMHRSTGNLVEVVTLSRLFDPCQADITGVSHAGEEMQDPERFVKSELLFPSGEPLPMCWLDSHYREKQAKLKGMATSSH
jgi:hypothetical protein